MWAQEIAQDKKRTSLTLVKENQTKLNCLCVRVSLYLQNYCLNFKIHGTNDTELKKNVSLTMKYHL